MNIYSRVAGSALLNCRFGSRSFFLLWHRSGSGFLRIRILLLVKVLQICVMSTHSGELETARGGKDFSKRRGVQEQNEKTKEEVTR
jgi:hypothetical protein